MFVPVSNFKISAAKAPADIDRKIARFVLKSMHLPERALLDFFITGKSVDSRRGGPSLVYSLILELDDRTPGAARLERLEPEAVRTMRFPELELPPESVLRHPVVVGTGPGGIFAALALALAGAEPVILDRGPEVGPRYEEYQAMLESRELDPDSNLLIGEGGAGTFSDGKLYTGTKDSRSGFILRAFVEAGAPPEIRWQKRPHIGSDYLRIVAANLRRRIVELGGTFRFRTEVAAPVIAGGRCTGVRLRSGEVLEAPAVLIAPGLGGRELARSLRRTGIASDFKSFQVGCRIEHPQEFVDRCQYHIDGARPAVLGAAEYHIVSRPGNGVPNVSSFCMCPGGTLLNATAWPGRSVTNGMSDFARDGEFANGCLIVTLPPDRFDSCDEAYGLLETMERATFEQGGSDYTLPAQDAAAFLSGKAGLTRKRTGAATGITPGRLDRIVPPELGAGLRAALKHFDRTMPGFLKYGKLVGTETCVSSPIRFLRNPETLESSVENLYLCGEGAGCAGGIMSAAADGLRQAEAMLKKNVPHAK